MSDDISGASEFQKEHSLFMKEALQQAQIALDNAEVPVGCVFVKDGQVRCRGRNETNDKCDASRHAELVAMESVGNQVEGMDLYVTVEPCIMCAAALAAAKIRRVYYGADNDKFGGCGSVVSIHCRSTFPLEPSYPGFTCVKGLGKEEAIRLLRDFYMQENSRAPRPREDGMAARVAKRHQREGMD